MEMFCNQCEQTAGSTGCTNTGVCGKSPESSALQDVLIYQTQGIGFIAHHLKNSGTTSQEVDQQILDALFTTVTNVNFDDERLLSLISTGERVKERTLRLLKEAKSPVADSLPPQASYKIPDSLEDLLAQAETFAIKTDGEDADIQSLKQLLIYGLKGMAAYTHHAAVLGQKDSEVFGFFYKALAALTGAESQETLVELNMECGKVNVRVMEMLDLAHTTRFGHPEPTEVSTELKAGPAIVVTGHDLLDLEVLLKQTEGTGVNVYTHGEMLPAHGYPELKKYPHLVGHFGTAWQNQQKEFDNTPAAFLFTTNCIQKPRESYKHQVFTAGLVAWPDVTHVTDKDFTPVIEKAKALGGLKPKEGIKLLTGCARNAVLGLADTIIGSVKSGEIKQFLLVGGCDGAKPGRNYYTELVEKAPKDSIILTLACGKFRFNHLDLGNINGIPRLVDIGQCNDAYSAVVIAQALAKAFDCGINELPLSLVLSWYEQKAVVILLSLLSLGIKGIRLGPTLPAFITPNILNFLVETFDIKPITTAEEDLKAIAAG